MIENDFPVECRGCREYCYRCHRRRGEYWLADIRRLCALRRIKMLAGERLMQELLEIEAQLEKMGGV